MYIARKIDAVLEEWAADPEHKPLLLRGARQIGKTTAIRHLAERFNAFIELNFETNAEIKAVFDKDYDIQRIKAAIEAYVRKDIVPGKTLLFFDEIQACPRAISSLRYFYEEEQSLHVVASGSLLEFVFGEIHDFGVGRIRNLFMHPLSFSEYMSAIGADVTMRHAMEATPERPLQDIVHKTMMDHLKDFIIVGGMPSAVKKFIQTHSYLAAQREHNDILVSLKADFGKYKKRIPSAQILSALKSVLGQTGGKFTYTDANLGLDYRQAKECTTLLEMARLVYRVNACRANGIPLGGDVKANSVKYIFLDTGLYLTESGLDLSEWVLDTPVAFVNRGPLAEMFAGLELAKARSPYAEDGLYYWHRESRGANAEVDYVVQFRNGILPIEVKSGTRGSMKSLRILMDEKHLDLGVRTSGENFGSMEGVRIIPLYMIGEYDVILRANGDAGNRV